MERELHRFAYYIIVKEGFQTVGNPIINDVIDIELTAPNRATADRMMKALMKDNKNVIEYDGVCID